MTPTEKDALDRWAQRVRQLAFEIPTVATPLINSDDALDRLRLAHKYMEDAITILEDGLPF